MSSSGVEFDLALNDHILLMEKRLGRFYMNHPVHLCIERKHPDEIFPIVFSSIKYDHSMPNEILHRMNSLEH